MKLGHQAEDHKQPHLRAMDYAMSRPAIFSDDDAQER